MFGFFSFGSDYFARGDAAASQPGGATATFTGFRLTLTQRGVSASSTQTIGGGSGLHFQRFTKFIERIESYEGATAYFDGFRIEITQRKVSAAGGASVRAKGRRLSLSGCPVSACGGARVGLRGERHQTKQFPVMASGGGVACAWKAKAQAAEEELLKLIQLLDAEIG